MADIQLGDLVEDIVTGFTGIAITRSEWLNKCIRWQVQPQELREGKPIESQAFDHESLRLVKSNVVQIEKAYTGGPARPEPTRAAPPSR